MSIEEVPDDVQWIGPPNLDLAEPRSYDYPILTLADVLTADELTRQPFAADTVLNGWSRINPLGEWFARMGREEQRTYVKNAVEFTLHGDMPLPYALAVLVRWASAPVPRHKECL